MTSRVDIRLLAVLVAAALFTVGSLSGCNTVEGAGDDIEAAGEFVEASADDVEDELDD